jgi:hypothetical protein
MFTTETTAHLAHPLPAVVAMLAASSALPRWCRGVRRIRRARAADAAQDASGCRLAYAISRDHSLRLTMRTSVMTGSPAEPGTEIVHTGHGGGVTITWTFSVRIEAPSTAGAASPQPVTLQTRLIARVSLSVDQASNLWTLRPAISRLIARRAPHDMMRLAALLEHTAATPAGLAVNGQTLVGTTSQ